MRSKPRLTLPNNTLDWGLTDYTDALQRQIDYVDKRRTGRHDDVLILTEHWPVYTLGVRNRADAAHPQPTNSTFHPDSRRIPLVTTNRGGDITYHGPGQIIGYPILNLNTRKDLRAYLHDLEQVLIQTLRTFGLHGHRREGKTGVWLGQRKIAAIGIAVRAWVTYHGFALNVNNDLTPFNSIIPCGIPTTEGTVTSIAHELGHPIQIQPLKKSIAVEFWEKFTHPRHRL